MLTMFVILPPINYQIVVRCFITCFSFYGLLGPVNGRFLTTRPESDSNPAVGET